jgi:hypothetical protein
MKLDFQSSVSNYSEQVKNIRVTYSKASENAIGFTQEKKINHLHEQNMVDSYFKIFDQNLTDTAIKNLISERLQPSYKLPEVHNMENLLAKANDLLNFSITI